MGSGRSASAGENNRDGVGMGKNCSTSLRMATPVSTGTSFNSGAPVALFQANPRQPVSYLDIFAYDVTRDGQKFLINTDVKPAGSVPMTVVRMDSGVEEMSRKKRHGISVMSVTDDFRIWLINIAIHRQAKMAKGNHEEFPFALLRVLESVPIRAVKHFAVARGIRLSWK